jgi:hypothetical protein
LASRLVRPLQRDSRSNQGPMKNTRPEESGDAILICSEMILGCGRWLDLLPFCAGGPLTLETRSIVIEILEYSGVGLAASHLPTFSQTASLGTGASNNKPFYEL